jgi:hypothetical protein
MHEELSSDDITVPMSVPSSYLDTKEPFDFPKYEN